MAPAPTTTAAAATTSPSPPPPALSALLRALARPAPEEWPAEPELKADRQRQDAALREQQDLSAGAVLEAPLPAVFAASISGGGDGDDDGAGAGSSRPPEEGDVVIVHLTVRAVEDGLDDYGPTSTARVLFTTRADEGPSLPSPLAKKKGGGGKGGGGAAPSSSSSPSTRGAPIALRLGKGRTRPPRALELVLSRMRPGDRRMARAAHRAYGFWHPDCGLRGLLPLAPAEGRGGIGEDGEEEEKEDGSLLVVDSGGLSSSSGGPPELVAFDVELLRVLPARGGGEGEEDDDEDNDDDGSSSSSSDKDEDEEEFDPNETDRAVIERRLKQLQDKMKRRIEERSKKKKKKKNSQAAEGDADADANAAAALRSAPVRALVYVDDRDSNNKNNSGAELDDLYKRTIRDSDSWESARAPNEATFALSLRPLAGDGAPLSAGDYFDAPASAPLSVPLGQRLLPRGVELALEHTTRGERALFIVPARLMAMPAGAGAAAAGGQGAASSAAAAAPAIPAPPPGAYQVEVCVELLDLVQVRDLTGDGGAAKRRLREGGGAFPADCPLHDTTARLHWRARRLDPSAPPPPMPLASQIEAAAQAGGGEQEEEKNKKKKEKGGGGGGDDASGGEEEEGSSDWAWPKEGGGGAGASWDYDSRLDPALGGRALVVDTGCGDLPAALELAVRLMTPGEVASVRFARRYAQAAPATGDAEAAAALRAAAAEDARQARLLRQQLGGGGGRGADADAPAHAHAYEFQVRLVAFEREGYWQRLGWRRRLALAERIKAKGNALYKAGKASAAAGRYDHLLRLLASTRDFDAPEEEEDEDGEEEDEDEDEAAAEARAEARAAAVDALRGAALANLAAAALAAGDGARALKACDAAEEMEGLPGAPDRAKVAFRRARALALVGDQESAEAAFERAAELAAGDAAAVAEVRAAQRRARQEARQHAAQQRATMGNFFARRGGGAGGPAS